MKKLLLLLAALLISASTLAGCGEPSTTDAPTSPGATSAETEKETLTENVTPGDTNPAPVDSDTAES